MNKKGKILSLSFLSTMVFTPLIALVGNFYNYNKVNIANEVDELEISKNTTSNFEKEIKSEINKKNEKYEKEKADTFQRKYFSEKLEFDLNLQFSLKTRDWPIPNEHKKSNIVLKSLIYFSDFGDSQNSIFLNNDSIKPNSNDKYEFEEGSNAPAVGAHKKDPNLKLDFSNSISHKQKSIEEGNNEVGKKINVETTLNSKYKLIGNTKYKEKDEIAYAASAHLGYGSDHYLVSDKYNSQISNGGYINFKDGGSTNIQPINRQIIKYSSEDNLKIFNFLFENNYLPSIENAFDGVVNMDYIVKNKKGMLVNFSENFNYLKNIADLNGELNKLIENNKKIVNTNIIHETANSIIERLKGGYFINTDTAFNALKKINTQSWDVNNSKLLDLLMVFKNNELSLTNINVDFTNLENVLVNEELMKEQIKFEENRLNTINLFYEDMITWLSVNEIKMTLNNKVLTIFKDGEIINNLSNIDVFNNVDKNITKQFHVSNIVIYQPKIVSKNLVCEEVELNKVKNTNDITNKVINNFLTDSNYKIAYEKDFVEKKFDNLNKKMGRTIPVPILPENITNYLFLNPFDQNVKFIDTYIKVSVEHWIRDTIKADNHDYTINNTFLTNRGWIDNEKRYLDFNNKDLFALLDLDDEFELINKNDENYSQDLKDFGEKFNNELSNKNFNDDDGVFYFLATISDWNGEKTIIGGEEYIGNWKVSDQKKFIDSVNKDGFLNIVEIEPFDTLAPEGQFILKLRSMKSNYIDNYKKYKEIIENFEKCFSPIQEEYIEIEDNFEIKKSKVIGYELKVKNNYETEVDPFYKKVIEIAKNSGDEIFNYENIIFNENNIDRLNEIKDDLDVIVNPKKEQYLQDKILSKTKISNSVDIWLIMGITIPIFIVIIACILISLKIYHDRRIDKELNAKSVKEKRTK